MTNWRYYWIAPLWGESQGAPREFYAPSLDVAFDCARVHWGAARGWRCLGAGDGTGRLIARGGGE